MNNETKEIKEKKIIEIMKAGDCSHKTATALYAGGYRKQSDSVKEFVERLMELGE